MRLKTEVSFFIISVLAGIGCCKNNSNSTIADPGIAKQANYQNLRGPIYLVLEPSLFKDCDKNPATASTCRQGREFIFEAGINDWFKHFAESDRPEAKIVYSPEEVPANSVNRPIHVSMDENGCHLEDKEQHPACFYSDSQYPKIVLTESAAFTIPTASHEIGHAFGLNHPEDEKTYSIMSPHGKGNRVLPIDMVTLCALHNECPPHDETWCKGAFYDKCRCPSESFADSEVRLKKLTLVCP